MKKIASRTIDKNDPDYMSNYLSIKSTKTDVPGRIRQDVEIVFKTSAIKEDSGMFTFLIPCLDICFSAESYEEGDKLIDSSIEAFMRYWGGEDNLDSSRLARHLKQLGFDPSKDIWYNLLKKQRIYDERFKWNKREAALEFEGGEQKTRKFEFA